MPTHEDTKNPLGQALIRSASDLLTNARAWCREGRSFLPRLLLWFLALASLHKIWTHQDSFSLWSGLILGIHELGHPFFGIFGEFLGVAGGSIAQLIVPIFGVMQFLYLRDYFASAFCFLWLGESFYNLSFYVADAVMQELPLVSPFSDGSGEIIHDWNYLLGRLGLFPYDQRLGEFCRWTGFSCVLFFLVSGYLILNEIYMANKQSSNVG